MIELFAGDTGADAAAAERLNMHENSTPIAHNRLTQPILVLKIHQKRRDKVLCECYNCLMSKRAESVRGKSCIFNALGIRTYTACIFDEIRLTIRWGRIKFEFHKPHTHIEHALYAVRTSHIHTHIGDIVATLNVGFASVNSYTTTNCYSFGTIKRHAIRSVTLSLSHRFSPMLLIHPYSRIFTLFKWTRSKISI